MFWVYILQNPGGRFYVGYTDNLEARLIRRTDDRTTYTRKNGPWTLVWSEAHQSRSSAIVREKRHIKGMKSAAWLRRELLKGRVPTSRD